MVCIPPGTVRDLQPGGVRGAGPHLLPLPDQCYQAERSGPRRNWAEVRVPGYNPTLLSASQANGEVELICRSPGVQEGYVTKGSRGRDALTSDAWELQRRGGRVDKHAAAWNMEKCMLPCSMAQLEAASELARDTVYADINYYVNFTHFVHELSFFQFEWGSHGL